MQPPAAEPAAGLRPGTSAVRALTARLLGVLVLLTLPAWGHGALDQRAYLADWWNLLAALTIGVPAGWLVLVSARQRGDVRQPAVALAAGVLLCLVLWAPGVVDVGGAARGLPWLWLVLPLSTLALGTVGSFALSGAYGVVVAVVYATVRVQPLGGEGPLLVVVLEGLLVLALSLSPVVLVVGARRAAERLDGIAETAARASATASRASAALATRRELDAAVHDTVLATLHTAVRDPRAPELPRMAARALETFRSAPDRVRHGPVRAAALAGQLQEALTAVAPDADLDVRDGPAVPAEVARALTDAALEAARNARRHGGGAGGSPGIRVEVGGTPDGTGLQVTVADDGIGFDPALVPPQRMGIAVSVVARMERVGGVADIRTSTGSGTVVRLAWTPAGTGPATAGAGGTGGTA